MCKFIGGFFVLSLPVRRLEVINECPVLHFAAYFLWSTVFVLAQVSIVNIRYPILPRYAELLPHTVSCFLSGCPQSLMRPTGSLNDYCDKLKLRVKSHVVKAHHFPRGAYRYDSLREHTRGKWTPMKGLTTAAHPGGDFILHTMVELMRWGGGHWQCKLNLK